MVGFGGPVCLATLVQAFACVNGPIWALEGLSAGTPRKQRVVATGGMQITYM